jgi:hypothetical protein
MVSGIGRDRIDSQNLYHRGSLQSLFLRLGICFEHWELQGVGQI